MKTATLLTGVLLAAGLTACATRGPTAVASGGCEEIRFPIYFVEQSDALTPTALEVIKLSAQQASKCKVRNVAVTGLDDGDAQAELSGRRAASVVAALTAQSVMTGGGEPQA